MIGQDRKRHNPHTNADPPKERASYPIMLFSAFTPMP